MQNLARNKGKVDLASGLVQKVVLGPSKAISRGLDWVSDTLSGMGHAAAMRNHIRDLQAQVEAAKQDSAKVVQLQQEVDDLRRLQGFAATPGRTAIPARVIGIFGFANRITLDVGSNQGVVPSLAVVAPKGLLGVVQTVSSDTCQVQLIYSPSTRLGAKAMRNPPTPGLLHGASLSQLIIDFLDPESPVSNDDEVVTSGFSEYIPAGIPIGTIYQIEDNADFGTRRAKVRPHVQLGTVRDVLVLK